jgi:hypothetical protein
VLEGLVTRPALPLEPARVGALLDESVHHAPVDTAAGELLNVYEILVPGSDTVDHLVFSTSRIALIEDELEIDAVFPGGGLHLGQSIEVRGRNFGFSTGDCEVLFDDRNANPKAGSTDSKLLLTVPMDLVVEPTGSTIELSVSSDHGSDSVPVLIGHPEHPLRGLVHVHWLSAEPPRILSGDRVLLNYLVRSDFDADAELTVDIIGDDAVVGAARLLDENGAELGTPVLLREQERLVLGVEIPEVPSGTSFVAGLRATVGDKVEDDIRVFRTDQATAPSRDEIRIENLAFHLEPGSVGSRVGSTILLDHDAFGTVEANVRFTEGGDYEVVVEPSTERGREPYLVNIAEPPGDGDSSFFRGVDPGDDGLAVETLRVQFKRNTDREGVPPTFFKVTIRRGNRQTSRTYVVGSTPPP